MRATAVSRGPHQKRSVLCFILVFVGGPLDWEKMLLCQNLVHLRTAQATGLKPCPNGGRIGSIDPRRSNVVICIKHGFPFVDRQGLVLPSRPWEL